MNRPSNEDAAVAAGMKKVAFSSDLDIATRKSPATSDTATLEVKEKPRSRPINDSIVEREFDQDDAEPSTATAPAPKNDKQSRFKATRQSQPQTPMFAAPMNFPLDNLGGENPIPQPPSKNVIADLIERPSSHATKAPDSNDFSDDAHRQEIAMEYQRHRIKRIHGQEGGFLGNPDEGENSPLEDEETGRKVSRFKAARIKQ